MSKKKSKKSPYDKVAVEGGVTMTRREADKRRAKKAAKRKREEESWAARSGPVTSRIDPSIKKNKGVENV